MTISTLELPVTVTVGDRSSMEGQLDAAVETVRAAAVRERRGILVTRLNSHQFTVELNDCVPFGMTRERQIW